MTNDLKIKILGNGIKPFLSVFKHFNYYNKEVTLNFTEKGLTIKEYDGSNVCFNNILIRSCLFDSYTIEKEYKLRINLKDFMNNLKNLKPKTDIIEISLYSVGESVTNIITKIINNNIFEFKTSVIEEEDNTPSIDINSKLEFNNKIKVIDNSIKDLIKINTKNNLGFILKNDKLNVYTFENSEDYEKGDFNKLELTENINYSKITNTDFLNVCCYSQEYLKKLSSILPEVYRLDFGDCYPLKVSFETDFIDFVFILAPKMMQ